MCFSAHAQYAPRPVHANGAAEPSPTVTTALAQDPNIYGLLAEASAASHTSRKRERAEPPIAPRSPTTIESVVVVLPDGRRLLITPLD
jgi:hypothetical protein